MEYYAPINRKPNNRRNFLHHDSAHLKCLEDNILFSQALRIKWKLDIKYFKYLKVAIIERDHKSELLDYHFENKKRADWKTQSKEKLATQENLPLAVINWTLLSIKNVIDKHWHIVSIHEKSRKIFW